MNANDWAHFTVAITPVRIPLQTDQLRGSELVMNYQLSFRTIAVTLVALCHLSLALRELPAEPNQQQLHEITQRARAVIQLHCHRCHNGPNSEGGSFDLLKVDELVKAKLLQPKNSSASHIMHRIAKAEMPPAPARLFADEADAIRQWIDAGAPAFPSAEHNRPKANLTAIYTALRDDLLKAKPADRPFLRYFTLHNLANDLRVSTEDLRQYRAALSKVVNSLSWKANVMVPRAVDAQGLLLAIDIRKYDWDRTEGWTKTIRAYPYGLRFRNYAEATSPLRKLDEEIETLSECPLPLVRADWFIATASRPPLYHLILDLPKTAGELEALLQVNIADNFRNPGGERIVRAAFHRSGVSNQNRLVERHPARYGYYWKSYDFKPDSARARLTRFPLGPLNLFPAAKHPFAAQAFVHDGGEIIFSLPNRLQAYLLVDGADRRIDEGPIDVVSDPIKTSGSNVIVNGVSCMSCHKHGMIPFQDFLREGHALTGDLQRAVETFYPTQNVLDRVLAEDERLFLEALEQTIGPFVKLHENKDRDLKSFAEPVGQLARRYRSEYLTIHTVAQELDQSDPDVIKQKIGGKQFKKLGLEALSKPGGVISRLEWESSTEFPQGISLMQELARELGYDIIR